MIQDAIRKLIEKKDLTESEAKSSMTEIMEGKATNAQIAAFLTALRMKGETVTEISEFARVMREKATKINAGINLVDTCGTGGDCSETFNISTAAAFVAAGAGVRIAKHGNRSVSSKSGSADVLENTKPAALFNRQVQPALCHQRQQAHGLERDRLSPRVWPGDHDDKGAFAKAHVDGHHGRRVEQWMAGLPQVDHRAGMRHTLSLAPPVRA